MKALLLNNFTSLHHKQHGTISLDEQSVNGVVSLNDDVACRSCIPFFSVSCEHEVLKLDTQNTSISVVNIEKFLDNFDEVKGRRCDFLMFDSNKIVLLDMTCSMEEYLSPHLVEGLPQQGKRLVARTQIEHTLDILTAEPAILAYINNKEKKEGVLAYRAKDEDLFSNVPKVIEKTANVWLRMEEDFESRKLSFPMSYGFVFKSIKYPEVYNW